MKKLILFSCSIAVFVLLLSAHKDTRYQTATPAAPAAGNIVSCAVPSANIAATPFAPSPGSPSAVMIRKNIYSLTPAEISSIKTGIAAMKALPVTDPTSWLYQAAIHGTTLPNNLPSWNSCQHGTQFFFSWHRMYLYFFERILRAKSGNPNLTLPYWNYQTNPVLHPDYRNSAPGNTLYDGSRNPSINGGGALSNGPMIAINNALGDIPYFDFQTDIEGPHGSIHVAIGGNMGSVPTAAKDPVFWLHHANIDRLWEQWLRMCGGRSNPTSNSTWMNKTYTFFDENGKAVNMTGGQVVNTAASLNYRYDFPFKLPCNLIIKWWDWKWKTIPLIRIPEKLTIDKNIQKASFRNAKVQELENFMRTEKMEKLNVSTTGPSDKLFVELEGLSINKAPEGVVEVYLNLPASEKPNPRSKSFVGVLDLFTGSGHEGHHEQGAQRINATTAARALGLRIADLKNAELTFFVRGNTINKRETAISNDIQIGSINFAVEKAER